MNWYAMREIVCGFCSGSTLHPHTVLEDIAQRLRVSAKDVKQVNYLCPECKHLGLAEIRNANQIADLDQPPRFADKVLFALRFVCDLQSCKFPVLVFAAMDRGTTDAQVSADMTQWTHADLKCHKGRLLKNPYEFLGKVPA